MKWGSPRSYDSSHEKRYLIELLAEARSRGYKTFFMLNSTEHEIFPAHKCFFLIPAHKCQHLNMYEWEK